MSVKNEELTKILTKFAASGWSLIDEPSNKKFIILPRGGAKYVIR
nr:hypothetical protein [uncultured Anaerocolumna sp.]